MEDVAHWLESTGVGEAVRVTPYLYPLLESLHIIGIAFMIGSALAVDMRLLGFRRTTVPVTTVTGILLPLSYVGFFVGALTGTGMFIANASAVISSPAAPWKFGLIALAGINILVFHTGAYRSVSSWDLHAHTPIGAKLAAMLSASTWCLVIVAGRFLAY